MLEELPEGKLRSSMANEDLSRALTGMASEVIGSGHVELALGWFLSDKGGDPLPQVPPDLFEMLKFVHDHGWREVEVGYKGRDYFEDCLLLALRKAQTAGIRQTDAPSGADPVARSHASQPAVQGT